MTSPATPALQSPATVASPLVRLAQPGPPWDPRAGSIPSLHHLPATSAASLRTITATQTKIPAHNQLADIERPDPRAKKTPTTPNPRACAPAPVLRAPRPVTGALRWPSTVARARWWPRGHLSPNPFTAAIHLIRDGTRRLAIDQPHALEARAARRTASMAGPGTHGGPCFFLGLPVTVLIAQPHLSLKPGLPAAFNRNTFQNPKAYAHPACLCASAARRPSSQTATRRLISNFAHGGPNHVL